MLTYVRCFAHIDTPIQPRYNRADLPCMSPIALQGVATRRYVNGSCEQLDIDDASTTAIT
jgi:hypothetical protein